MFQGQYKLGDNTQVYELDMAIINQEEDKNNEYIFYRGMLSDLSKAKIIKISPIPYYNSTDTIENLLGNEYNGIYDGFNEKVVYTKTTQSIIDTFDSLAKELNPSLKQYELQSLEIISFRGAESQKVIAKKIVQDGGVEEQTVYHNLFYDNKYFDTILVLHNLPDANPVSPTIEN